MPNPADLATWLRRLPKVDLLLEDPAAVALLQVHPRRRVLGEVRAHLDRLREGARAGRRVDGDLEPATILAAVRGHLEEAARPYYRRVVNATGVLLHTGLGRAPLAASVARRVGELARHPQRVEIRLRDGQRGGRDRGCERLLQELLGCEAATVVNNNAAATMLILGALTRGRGVVVSRGELVEIGGSYRIPDILRESGARLVEVGTTNRTHPRDYRRGIDEETGMLLKVHTSNYRIVGFTKEVGIEELVEIGRERGVPVVHDLGSGCLVDLAARGRPGEELVQASIQAGVDLVCFSGDKLLGGPQAGIIAGKADAVERCRSHPMFRAMRPGRLVYTALEATLELYLGDDAGAVETVPALRRLLAPEEELERRARDLATRLSPLPGCRVDAVPSTSQAGSGSLPARQYPSWAVRVTPEGRGPEPLAAALRRGDPAVLARIHDNALWLDLRSLDGPEDEEIVARRLREAATADPLP
ncbi:MAG: L-seryl-tRNA(Sec) selenium transferase [Acidobacteriota bacterium]